MGSRPDVKSVRRVNSVRAALANELFSDVCALREWETVLH